jgi:GTP 3',8-cyclase
MVGCLNDSFNRPINYLRVSITDRCNLRCLYCMPEDGVPMRPHDEILRYEEILAVIRAAADLGISKVRITGGEPLVRLGVVDFIRSVARIPGIDDLAVTTNGMLLEQYAAEMAAAGLRRVNVSLDTLQPDKFRRMTRRGDLDKVLAGIEAAHQAGLRPVKINCVVIRDYNDDEIVDLARLALDHDWHIRFIELMPLGAEDNTCGQDTTAALAGPDLEVAQPGEWDKLVPVSEMRGLIETIAPLLPADSITGNGPARYFRFAGATGTIGFISPVTEHFCFQCNRLRLTADGRLRPCLMSDDEIDIRSLLRSGASPEELKAVLSAAIAAKPEKHLLGQAKPKRRVRPMSQIGG